MPPKKRYSWGDSPTQFVKAQVTVMVPVDLIEFVREETGWSEKVAIKHILDTWNHMGDAGRCEMALVAGNDLDGCGVVGHAHIDEAKEMGTGWQRGGEVMDVYQDPYSISWLPRVK